MSYFDDLNEFTDFDDLNEFTDEEIANNGVSSANDALEGSAAENKKVFDRLPKYIAGRINTIISSLRSFAFYIDEKFTDLTKYIDSTFLYKTDLPSKVSVFDNDSRYITAAEVPDNLSSYNNDAGFITDEDLSQRYGALSLSGDENNGYIGLVYGDNPQNQTLLISCYNISIEGDTISFNTTTSANGLKVTPPTDYLHAANKGYVDELVDELVGDIDAALDNILAIQNELISRSVNLAKDGD